MNNNVRFDHKTICEVRQTHRNRIGTFITAQGKIEAKPEVVEVIKVILSNLRSVWKEELAGMD